MCLHQMAKAAEQQALDGEDKREPENEQGGRGDNPAAGWLGREDNRHRRNHRGTTGRTTRGGRSLDFFAGLRGGRGARAGHAGDVGQVARHERQAARGQERDGPRRRGDRQREEQRPRADQLSDAAHRLTPPSASATGPGCRPRSRRAPPRTPATCPGTRRWRPSG